MKKITLLFVLLTGLIACKQKETTPKENKKTAVYQLDPETVIVNWVGYKFTEKKGVKGMFKKITISNHSKGNSISNALKNVTIDIPVSSIFSNNETRDTKLKTLFFGLMDQTEFLSAKVTSVSDHGGVLSLKMNNETHDLPFTLTSKKNTAYLKATIDLNIWHTKKSITALHTACELLHTGADGISKTWDTVDVDAVLNFTLY